MKFTALILTVTALAAGVPAWSGMVQISTAAAGAKPAESWQAQRHTQERQDDARYSVCHTQRVDNPAKRTVDFTAGGRSCLIDALGQSATVQGTLVLLRNASVALRKTPEDKTLRLAALRAVDRARVQLAVDLPGLRERFKEEAAALDMAEFSIHLPQQYQQQQQWRLEAYGAALQTSR